MQGLRKFKDEGVHTISGLGVSGGAGVGQSMTNIVSVSQCWPVGESRTPLFTPEVSASPPGPGGNVPAAKKT